MRVGAVAGTGAGVEATLRVGPVSLAIASSGWQTTMPWSSASSPETGSGNWYRTPQPAPDSSPQTT